MPPITGFTAEMHDRCKSLSLNLVHFTRPFSNLPAGWHVANAKFTFQRNEKRGVNTNKKQKLRKQ
jgi:hypothetical protein